MKILEMIATLGPGGAEALIVDLSVKFASMGADVKIFLLAGVRGKRGEFLSKRLANMNVEIIGDEERNPASLSNLFRLIKVINSWHPDVVHCNLYNSEIPFAVARLVSSHRPSITVRTLHDTEVNRIKPLFIRKYLNSAFQYTVACSSSVEDSYRRLMGQYCTNNLVTIENGCTLAARATSCVDREDARKKFSIPEEKFLIVNVAAFRGDMLATSQKAQDTILKAFAVAFMNNDEAVLAFAGDGPLLIEAKKLTRDLGIESKVYFLGDLPDPWLILQAADLFVMPSRYEGLSLALIEAASTGLPVIASDIQEIRKISPEGAWNLCPVEDIDAFAAALKVAIAGKEKLRSKAESVAKQIRFKYSIDNCAEKYWELFSKNLKYRI